MDIFDILDCALRTHFLEVVDVPSAPIWARLPAELSAALALTDESLGGVLRLVWQIREQLLGKPDSSEARALERVSLQLGLLSLRHREGRLEVGELLTRAFHITDSYVCGVAPQPFLHLRRALAAGEPDGGRVALLFAPYTESAEQCVQQCGLRPGAALPAE